MIHVFSSGKHFQHMWAGVCLDGWLASKNFVKRKLTTHFFAYYQKEKWGKTSDHLCLCLMKVSFHDFDFDTLKV